MLIAAATALVEARPGSPSVDRALGMEAKGTAWALAALATGVAGSTLAIEAAKRLRREEETAEETLRQSSRFQRGVAVPEHEPAHTAA